MGYFPDTIAAALGGRTPRCANLVLFDFVTTPVRVWTGNGVLKAAGEQWSGLGGLGAIGALEQAMNGEAPEVTMSLSGLDSSILSIARDEFEAEAKDRLVVVYLQFFNQDDDIPLDAPYPVWSGRIQRPTFTIDASGARDISISIESLFALRSRPNYAMYTIADQQSRFPGDEGFGFVTSLRNKTVTWPDY